MGAHCVEEGLLEVSIRDMCSFRSVVMAREPSTGRDGGSDEQDERLQDKATTTSNDADDK